MSECFQDTHIVESVLRKIINIVTSNFLTSLVEQNKINKQTMLLSIYSIALSNMVVYIVLKKKRYKYCDIRFFNSFNQPCRRNQNNVVKNIL